MTVLAPLDPTTIPAGWPPALRLLLGPAAGDLWSAVLEPLGGAPTALRPIGVSLQPDGAATAQYSADITWTDGRATREVLAATTGSRIPDGAAVLDGEADGQPVRVGVWRWPLDPALPALGWAASAAAVGARLAELGLAGGTPPRLRLRAYRPGRRAVVEAETPEGRFFLKVVRPAVADRLARRHGLLAGSVPVPPVLATTDDGVVVLPGLAGKPLRGLLSGDGADLPGAGALDAVLDALPAELAQLPPARRAPGDALSRVAAHAAVVAATLPELAPRLSALTTGLAAVDRGDHPLVPVHGDFYESQLLVDGGRVVGLLDVDTAGAGARIDDWATLVAHLAVQQQVLPDPRTTARWTAELLEVADRRWPRAQLDARVAAVAVGLATGPFRVQQRGWPARTEQRVALAERWAAGAR